MQYTVLARLRQGATIPSANAEMALLQKRIASDYTDPNLRKDHSVVRVEPYVDLLVNHNVQRGVLALLAASGVLWLIAIANATNLMLARSTARQREIAMRGALGASRWRVMQQMVVEAINIELRGGSAGNRIGPGVGETVGTRTEPDTPGSCTSCPRRMDAFNSALHDHSFRAAGDSVASISGGACPHRAGAEARRYAIGGRASAAPDAQRAGGG